MTHFDPSAVNIWDRLPPPDPASPIGRQILAERARAAVEVADVASTPIPIGLAEAAGIPAPGAVPSPSRRALRELARAHAAETFESVRALSRSARDERVRLQACTWLAEMGEGRPVTLTQSDVTLTQRRTGAEYGDAELLALRRPRTSVPGIIDNEPVSTPSIGGADAAD